MLGSHEREFDRFVYVPPHWKPQQLAVEAPPLLPLDLEEPKSGLTVTKDAYIHLGLKTAAWVRQENYGSL